MPPRPGRTLPLSPFSFIFLELPGHFLKNMKETASLTLSNLHPDILNPSPSSSGISKESFPNLLGHSLADEDLKS
jgi:hypothetical protein